MRNAGIAAGAVLLASLVARLLVPGVSLYLEPHQVVKQWHVWQLVTWVPAGASLTFVAHALITGFAVSRGARITQWLGVTFIAGALTTLLGEMVPAVFSCTFTGAGVGAAVALGSWAQQLEGPRRAAVMALALVPALLDVLVDGLYVLVPFGFAFFAFIVWVRVARRRLPETGAGGVRA